MGLNLKETFEKVEKFEGSVYGKELVSKVRFAPYKPEIFSNEDWQKLLGADVNNLKHMRLMYGFTRALINHSPDVSDEERDILLVTALVHDWAESILGDIPCPLKKEADDLKEKQILLNIFAEFGIINSEKILEAIFDEKSDIAQIWKSIEIAAYLRTAFNAWRRSFTVDSSFLLDLESMSKNILLYHLKEFLQCCEKYPHIAYFLKINAEIIDEILLSCDEETKLPSKCSK